MADTPSNPKSRSSRGGGRGNNNRDPLPRPVQISKKLARLLRHAAADEGISLDNSGYANVSQVLENRLLKSFKVTFPELQALVSDNDKQRFALKPVDESNAGSGDARDWVIRANQGHSLKVESEGLLTAVRVGENVPERAVHGTTHAAWMMIVKTGGLKPMARNHVHFAAGLPAGFKSVTASEVGEGAKGTEAPPVISGMRTSSTVLMFLNVEKAMGSGIKLWRSDNGVILSEGNEDGIVPLELFELVEDRTGQGVLLEDGKIVKEAPASWEKKSNPK